jgi:hypothetical protein
MSEDLIIGIVFGLVGALLGFIGVILWMRTQMFIARSKRTKGSITHLIYSRSSEGGGYAPVFQFTTLSGQSIEVSESLYSNPPGYSVGQSVDILYDPEKPSHARISKWSSLYFAPLLLSGMGIVFLGVGAVMSAFKTLNVFLQ